MKSAHARQPLDSIGRAPTTLLLQGFLLTWGVVGFYSTVLFHPRFPGAFVPLAMTLALVTGVIGMKIVGAFGSRFMKSVENYAVGKEDLFRLDPIDSLGQPIDFSAQRRDRLVYYATKRIEQRWVNRRHKKPF